MRRNEIKGLLAAADECDARASELIPKRKAAWDERHERVEYNRLVQLENEWKQAAISLRAAASCIRYAQQMESAHAG